MIRVVDIAKPDASLAELVALACSGAEVVLADDGKPVARVVPIASPRPRRIAGLNRDAMTPSEDFDAPRPEGGRLGDLPQILYSLPRLSDEEAKALAEDIERSRRELPPAEEGDIEGPE